MLRTSPFLLLIAIVSFPGRAAEASDEQLRAEVVKFCSDLKAAYDAGDRAKVLSHFQQSTASEDAYSKLGQLHFWEKPIKDIQTEDGVIRVTFTMDPQSDSPAQFLTLDFVRAADGELRVKSPATPQRLEALADLARELQARRKIGRWPLLEQLIREQNTVLPADAQVFAFAEIYRGDEAILLACASMAEELVPLAARFERKDKGWSLQPRFAKESEIDAMLHAPEVKIVRRQAGLALDSLPQFLAYLLSDQERRFREASDRHDFKQCASIADEMLVGFTADNAQTLLSTLGNPGPVSKVTLLSSTQQPDGRLLAAFQVDGKYGPSTSRYFLEKEGSGWVIEEPYSGGARKTMTRLQDLAAAMEVYQSEHEHYPQAASLEELRRLLQPKYMPAVPLTDAWRTPIRFEVAKDRKSYRLISAGADRKFNPQSWAAANQELADFAEDVVFENGAFVRMWRTSD